MHRCRLLLLSACLLPGILPGQEPRPTAPPRFHLQVRVRLQNGRSLVGIVREGRLHEKLVVLGTLSPVERFLQRRYGLGPVAGRRYRFVPCRPDDPEGGLRLWHHDRTGGYVYLRYRDILRVERLRRVSPAELRALDEAARRRRAEEKARLRRAWRERQERERAHLRALRAARRKREGAARKDEEQREDAGRTALDGEARQRLFARFHPSRGWTPGRKAVIRWRQVTLGVFPTPEEREWLRHYDAWKIEYDRWRRRTGGRESQGSRRQRNRSAP